MPKKSATDKIVRKTAADVSPASEEDLKRLHAAMEGPIDTSEIPERRGPFRRLKRDAAGKLPVRRSLIREAVTREMHRLNLTPYRLWKEARAHCPTLSQAAVYEFLKGQRQLELPSAEALMSALSLKIARTRTPKRAASVIRPKPAAGNRNP